MISGYGSSGSLYKHHHFGHSFNMLSLPMPFSIPKVLHNFLFEDVELEFNLKQKDLHEALKFSYISLVKLNEKFNTQIAQLKEQSLKEPDSIKIKNEYEDIELDRQQANYDFKSLVEVMLDMLDRQQIEALLRFSKVLV